MAFSSAQRAAIYEYMGWSPGVINTTYDAIITRLQSIADGGQMADGSFETRVASHLTSLAAIETRLTELWDTFEAGKVDELDVDPVRAAQALRAEGRRFVCRISIALNAAPDRDVFFGSVGQ